MVRQNFWKITPHASGSLKMYVYALKTRFFNEFGLGGPGVSGNLDRRLCAPSAARRGDSGGSAQNSGGGARMGTEQ